MESYKNILTSEESAVFKLRALYNSFGYSQYKMSKFEEYDLYAKNKDFLVSESVITFTDTDGKLLALKPDVTLSIIKNNKDVTHGVKKVYYDEHVYRVSKGTKSYKEIMQAGLECLGDIDDNAVIEVILLAIKSIELISKESVLDISNLGLVGGVIDAVGVSARGKAEIFSYLKDKNLEAVKGVLTEENIDSEKAEVVEKLVTVYGSAEKVIPSLDSFKLNAELEGVVESFKTVLASLIGLGAKDKINVDFSVISDLNYYNGWTFKGFVSGIPNGILSGGQYDALMQKMGRRDKAIGFAVYLDELDKLNLKESGNVENADGEKACAKKFLNVALPKGRLGEKVYYMFEKAGFSCPSIKENNRKLIFENEEVGVRYFWVKPSDVAIYVERGAADVGVAGKDILLEYSPEVYELLDLKIGKCDMAVASMADFKDDRNKTLTVATKFTNVAKSYYASQGRDIDIIHLNGSIEIAPILGLSDVIVDIVETGATLKENNLVVVEKFQPISARLIANKANFKFKSERIEKIISSLKIQTENL